MKDSNKKNCLVIFSKTDLKSKSNSIFSFSLEYYSTDGGGHYAFDARSTSKPFCEIIDIYSSSSAVAQTIILKVDDLVPGFVKFTFDDESEFLKVQILLPDI